MKKLHYFQAFPSISDRKAWDAARNETHNEKLVAEVRKLADEAMATDMPALTAERYMDHFRNGNRSQYEAPYFARRCRLTALVLAECFFNEGRYIDGIIEHLWAIISEYTWCLPAHTYDYSDPFPDTTSENIDLFAAETGAYIAVTMQLVEERIAAISPKMVNRVRLELVRRCVVGTEDRIATEYHWVNGYANWTPWVCANLVWTANWALKDDPARFSKVVWMLEPCIERYRGFYPADGSCTEGVAYWCVSPLMYFIYLDALNMASDNEYVHHYSDGLFKKMCEFICYAWYCKNYFSSFADYSIPGFNPGVMQAMAERADSEMGKTMAECYLQENGFPKLNGMNIQYKLYDIFMRHGEAKSREDFFKLYEDSQVLFCLNKGNFIVMKGGSNDECHNHNDVGQFILGTDGEMCVLDLGKEVYSRKSFGADRYTNYLQSGLSHNPLVFDGVPQMPGLDAAAQDFKVEGNADNFTCSMELARCYPPELGLISYRRTLKYDGKTVRVTDCWKADHVVAPSMTLFHRRPDTVIETSAKNVMDEVRSEDSCQKHMWDGLVWRRTIQPEPAAEGVLEISMEMKSGK